MAYIVEFVRDWTFSPGFSKGDIVVPCLQRTLEECKDLGRPDFWEEREVPLKAGESYPLNSSVVRPNIRTGWRLLAGAIRVIAVKAESVPDSKYRELRNFFWTTTIVPQLGTIVQFRQKVGGFYFAGFLRFCHWNRKHDSAHWQTQYGHFRKEVVPYRPTAA